MFGFLAIFSLFRQKSVISIDFLHKVCYNGSIRVMLNPWNQKRHNEKKGEICMSKFVTEIGLEVQNGLIVRGYSNRPGLDSIESCIKAGGEIFDDDSCWRVVTMASIEQEYGFIDARIVVSACSSAGHKYCRRIKQSHGWLLLGNRGGKSSAKFIPSEMERGLYGATFMRCDTPDGLYSFAFNLADDDYTVLVSDGEVDAHACGDEGQGVNLIRYDVTDATWVAYCTSRGESGARKCTIVTELDAFEAKQAIDVFLEEHGLCDLMDLIDAWSELIDFDEPFSC